MAGKDALCSASGQRRAAAGAELGVAGLLSAAVGANDATVNGFSHRRSHGSHHGANRCSIGGAGNIAVLDLLNQVADLMINDLHLLVGDAVFVVFEGEGVFREHIAVLVVHLNGTGFKLQITDQAAALFKLNAHNIRIENRLFTVRNVTGDKAADAGLGRNDTLSVKNQNASAANTFQLMQELCHIITLFL